MEKYGKIDFFNDLVIATNIIQNNTEIIVNPTEDEYLANGYKHIVYDEKVGYNVEMYYEEDESHIYVKYRYTEIIEPDIV